MRNAAFALGSLTLVAALFGGCAAGADGDNVRSNEEAALFGADADNAIPGQWIVVMDESMNGFGVASVMDDVARMSADSYIEHTYSVIPGFAGRLSDEAVATLRRDPRVKYIEQDRLVEISEVQLDPRFGLDRIDQRSGTDGRYDDGGNDGSGVHIYVLDTGIRSTHSEFTGRMGAGFDAIGDGNGSEDCHSHGTHVASSAAGTRYGVAKGATVHPIRVLDCDGFGSTAQVIAGIDHVAANGARPAVINMSLSTRGGPSPAQDDATRRAIAAGVAVAVAAGNDNKNACDTSPARTREAVTVAATDRSDTRASFSNFGDCVDVFAPGVQVIGAGIADDNAVATKSGTSMSSPHVAGAIARYLQSHPEASPEQVHEMVRTSATKAAVSDPAGSPNRLLFGDLTEIDDTPEPEPEPDIWPTLAYGASGDDVITLQYLLNQYGYGLVVDGIFGDLTRAAVIDFQEGRAIGASGEVKRDTWTALLILIGYGDSGPAVSALQDALRYRHGFTNVVVDGFFGDGTNQAVFAFQEQNCLFVDGLVGDTTWQVLLTGAGGCR